MNSKNKVVKDGISLSLSRIAIFSIGFVKSIILAKILNPAGFGVLNIVNLVVNYNKFAQLGLRAAAMREAPLELGKGNIERAEELKNAAFTINLIFSLLVSFFLIIISIWSHRDGQLRLAYFISGVVFSLMTLYALYETKSMIDNNFLFIAKVRIVDASVKSVIVLLAALILGLQGVFAAMIIAGVLIILYCGLNIKLNFRPCLNGELIRRLGKVGIPLFASGIVWSLFLTADRLLIVSHIDRIGKEQYGLYSFAIVLLTIFYVISSDTGSVVYRHSLEVYAKTNNAKELFPLISKASRFIGYLVPFAIGQIFILIPPIVIHIFPKYVAAIPIIRIMSLAFFFLMIAIYHTTLMTTLNKQILHLYIRGLFLLLLVVGIIVLIRSGYGIMYISIAKMLLWFMYSLFIIAFTSKFITAHWKQRLSYLIELFIPAIIASLLILIFSTINVNIFIISFLFTIAYCPIIFIANKRLNLASIIRDFSGRIEYRT